MFCVLCFKDKTSLNSHGSPNWYILNKDTSKRICGLCYRKRHHQTHKEYDRNLAKRRLLFKDKRIYLGKNPRSGICKECGKIGRTEMHHKTYDPTNPLANTTELCCPCHNKTKKYFQKHKT